MRKALLISSNNRIDRDGEIVSTKALQRYVHDCHDDDGNYIGGNVVLMRHKGEPIGVVLECGLMHGFLVEVIQELPNAVVNIGTHKQPKITTIKSCWDYIEKHQDRLGVSQGFLYHPMMKDEHGVFHQIIKFESSILPLNKASNPYTFVRVFS